MDSEFIQQGWIVYPGSYRWIDAAFDNSWGEDSNRTRGRVLIELGVRAPKLRMYDPTDVTGAALFRVFADTQPTEDEILRFANSYGLLGGSARRQLHLDDGTENWGEPHFIWRHEILTMRTGVRLWDMVRKEDSARLERHVKQSANGVTTLERVQQLTGHATTEDTITMPSPSHTDLVRDGDVLRITIAILQDIANAHQGYVSPLLQWSEDLGKLELHITSNSLLGILWLQFATAITGNANFRQCGQCGRWFQVELQKTVDVLGALDGSRRKRRIDRAFCSNACRSKAYRQRVEKAQQLHATGIPVEDIAKQLDSSIETVSKWLDPNKK